MRHFNSIEIQALTGKKKKFVSKLEMDFFSKSFRDCCWLNAVMKNIVSTYLTCFVRKLVK